MKSAIIFDIDGTLADASHRIHHIKKKPKDWDAFFGAQIDDKPHRHIVDMLLAIKCMGKNPVIFVSGRPANYREVTEKWLTKHGIFNPFIDGKLWLFMRPTGDRRDDDIVKRELLGRIRMEGFEPIMAFDDRDRVVKMWRAMGIPCLQVAEGDF